MRVNDRISIGFSRRPEEEEWSSAPAALLAQHCEVMFHMTGEDLCVVDSGFPELFSQRLIASEVSRDLADFGRGQTRGVGCGYAETLHSRDIFRAAQGPHFGEHCFEFRHAPPSPLQW